MKQKKRIALVGSLAIMCGGVGVLYWLNTHHSLGAPAVKTRPLLESQNLLVELPDHVLDYQSKALPIDKVVLDFLPKDTSYGRRRYIGPDKWEIEANVVLMGTDRTSLHKPQFCLEGQGWRIDQMVDAYDKIPIERPVRFDLPIVKLLATKEIDENGQHVLARGIYIYWYVADGEISASKTGFDRMWSMAKELVRTGTLQRWAYISYFSVCTPGQEEATYDRMKKLIAASVPEFQLVPKSKQPPSLAAHL